MNLKKVERNEKNIVELEVQVGREQFEAAVEKAYHRNAGRINVPGFRKGKAPRGIIEKMYGSSVFYEDAVNFAYPDAYGEALEAAGIEPVDQADVEILEISPEGFTFKAKVTVEPEVKLSSYKGLEAAKSLPVVTDEEIQMEIDRLKKRNARITPVDRPVQNGDIAVIDFEGSVDGKPFEGGKGENHSLTIGSGQFIPGFEEQLIGLSAGEEKDVEVTFPEEYHAKELAGKKAVFHCKVIEVRESVEPEVDDEFAKDVSEFDTLDELKNNIRERILENHTRASESEFEEALLDKLLEGFEADIPPVMVEKQIDKAVGDMDYRLSMQGMNLDTYMKMTGSTAEQFRENMKPRAERQVKVGLALAEIARTEGIEISEEEVAQEYESLSKRYDMPVERIRGMLGEASLKKDLLTGKALQLVKDSAVIKEKKPESESAEELKDKKEKAPAAVKKPRAKPRKKEETSAGKENEENE